jgi:peptide chain release factor 1
MIDWSLVRTEYNQMLEQLSNPDLDTRKRAELQKKYSHYTNVLELYDRLQATEKELADQREMLTTATDDFKELCIQEIAESERTRNEVQIELDDLLYPADDKGERSGFLEIRAAAGGDEASLFAADLYRMYSLYALRKGWEISIVESQISDVGGFKDLVAHIKGKGVYKRLKFESGVHRVQRVPTTETAGRVHTSTVTVAVLPEVDDVEVNINPQDLRIDTYRSSGAGGQHVNTTDSAIRITHIPSGLVVTCQDERSQTKNKARALKTLQARLYELERQKQEAETSKNRKQQVGSGDRSEKIRTYNFPQNRVSDHRIELSLKKLDMVMQGDMDDLIEPLRIWELNERRKHGSLLDS